jgi:predicted RNase H-like HicB family nuclease
MQLLGELKQCEGKWWYAGADLIGAYTQGKSRRDAPVMLADAVECLVGAAGFNAEAQHPLRTPSSAARPPKKLKRGA